MRRIRLLTILTVLVALFTPVAGARAATSNPSPAEGLYESCAGPELQTTCIMHLERMRRAGFTVVLNYTALTYSDPVEVRTYARAAHALGMKIIWALQDPTWWEGDIAKAYPALSAECGCRTNAGIARHLVDLVKRLPATWGYYVGDETDPSQAARANAFSATIHRDDPHHPRLFVGIGIGARRVIRPFASQADVLGADVYPIGQGQPLNVIGQVGAQLRSIARPGQETAMVLQSFAFAHAIGGPDVGGPGAWPTGDQMHTMLRAAGSAHPSLILWWAYYQILESPDPALHWNALRDAVFPSSARRDSAHTESRLAERLRTVPGVSPRVVPSHSGT